MNPQGTMDSFKCLLHGRVFIDPLLVHTYVTAAMNDLRTIARGIVGRLCEVHLNVESFCTAHREVPFSLNVLNCCLEDALFTTAIQVSLERTGTIRLSEEYLRQATLRIENLLERMSLEYLYDVYWTVVEHDVLQPFTYRRQMPLSEYLMGMRHFPYVPANLDMYLFIGANRGTFRLANVDGKRHIFLTKLGIERFQFDNQVMHESEYSEKRAELSHFYLFDNVKHWDDLYYTAWPRLKDLNQLYLDWLGIDEGTRVLELSCKTGTVTLDAGLNLRVGQQGNVDAVDSSQQMLDEAQRKYDVSSGPTNISFTHASFSALPFPDCTFDMALGVGFLAYNPPVPALSEMFRVVKPGGWISVQQGVDFSMNQSFFTDWIEPILKHVSKADSASFKTPLPKEEDVRQYFTDLGLEQIVIGHEELDWAFDDPEATVQLLVRGTSLVKTALGKFSWDDRKTLIQELIDRGTDVFRRYQRTDRCVSLPVMFIKGRRPI